MRLHYWETRQSLTPQKALQFLKEGNERFINNLRMNHNLLQLVNDTADKQFPFAAILSCSDSRVSTELIFDQGLGDIFSVRLAGNIASVNAIGSIEFSCKVLGSKLIMVLGHTRCGAVKGACDHVQLGNLNTIIEHIGRAVDLETETVNDRTSNNKQFVDNVTRINVQYNIDLILESSEIIREMLEAGEIDIVGAIYDVETGKVEFMDRAGANTNNHAYETQSWKTS
jgi:carbonic anhydrase